jgi:hypothetical protein
VVGIPQGRKPLSLPALANPAEVAYVGRLAPTYSADGSDQPLPITALTLASLEVWQESNRQLERMPIRPAL